MRANLRLIPGCRHKNLISTLPLRNSMNCASVLFNGKSRCLLICTRFHAAQKLLKKKVKLIVKNLCKKNRCKFRLKFIANGESFLTKPDKTICDFPSSRIPLQVRQVF